MGAMQASMLRMGDIHFIVRSMTHSVSERALVGEMLSSYMG